MSSKVKYETHLKNIGIFDLWETPEQFLEYACRKYHVEPILDVCCGKENKKCEIGLTEKDNGLAYDWPCDFFMNPPYSEVDKWVAKAYKEHIKNNVTGIALIYVKTDTKMWHKYIEGKAEVHFIRGRVQFLLDGRKSKNRAPYPSCWIIWRKKEKQNVNEYDLYLKRLKLAMKDCKLSRPELEALLSKFIIEVMENEKNS